MKSLHYQSIQSLSQQLRSGSLTSVDLTKHILERISTYNPEVNAFINVLDKQALAAAKQADQDIASGNVKGPLHGIPVAVKDMYDTAGIATTAGFKQFNHRIPHKDAAVVTALHNAGAILIGKTNMHQLAMGTTSLISAAGAVHNPWNTAYVAGGSSGGSSAALASGLCFATIDTDAVGSVRLPAACCGVVGYKATWNRYDSSGILEGEKADPTIVMLAATGVQARTPMDALTVASILPPVATPSETPLPKRLRIGRITAIPSLARALDKLVDPLQHMGHSIHTLSLPAASWDIHTIKADRAALDDTVFKNTDIIVSTTLDSPVPTIDSVGDDPQGVSPQNTFFANYYGLPAVSIPCGFDKAGVPIGCQLIGKPNTDKALLTLAQAVQDAQTLKLRHPRLHNSVRHT